MSKTQDQDTTETLYWSFVVNDAQVAGNFTIYLTKDGVDQADANTVTDIGNQRFSVETDAAVSAGVWSGRAITADGANDIMLGDIVVGTTANSTATETNVDANETKIDLLQTDTTAIIAAIGTPANIDSGGATLADNLKKLADDSGGATFDATTDSQTAIAVDTTAIDAKTTNLPGDPASETNVDANETKIDTLTTRLGTPANIDSGGATIADNLKKLADDNGGATFDATTDSQTVIAATTVAIDTKTTNLPGDPASETNVDANETKIDTLTTRVGTPANIDSGGATISDNLKKLADDNGGADFNATTDSQKALSDEVNHASYGLDKHVRSVTPANGLAIDANNRVDISLIEGGDATDAITTACDASLASINLDHLIQVASTVSDAGATATDFDTALAEASDDHYNDMVIVFTNNALAGQARRILDYDGGAKNIIVQPAFTEAPGNGDAFVIVSAAYLQVITERLGTQAKSDVNAEVDISIQDVNLDHFIQVSSTVNDAGATTLDFDTDLTEASDDHYNDMIISFTDNALAGQSRRISAYDGTAKNITVSEAWTEAPADGDAFVIVSGSYLNVAISPTSVAALVDAMWDEESGDHETDGTTGERQAQKTDRNHF